jgi:CheY-like chemotaxis protein
MQATHPASTARLVVVIDDDPIVLEAMEGLLRKWGYRVIAAASDRAVLAELAELNQRPDLIICDYRLAGGEMGNDVIERLRKAFQIPAILISGEIVPDRVRKAGAPPPILLNKPVNPAALRALLIQIMGDDGPKT